MRSPGILAGIILFLFLSLTLSTGLRLDPDGGYHVVVAVDENQTVPDVPSFMTAIKASFQSLNDAMYRTTKKFFIRSLEIILPQSWAYEGDPWPFTVYNFHTADIRISADAETAYVMNPHHCGLSGDFVTIPFQNGIYNENELLRLWARYRWGAFEENGDAGSSRFPYSQWKTGPEEADRWEPNGCINMEQLIGDYKPKDGGVADCKREQMSEMDPSCEFRPGTTPGLSSSLMNALVTKLTPEFCNSTTHKRENPTPQNVYCDHRSVMEVIGSCSDAGQVTIEAKTRDLTITVTRPMSERPLYVLINAWGAVNHTSLIYIVNGGVARLFLDEDKISNDTPVAVGIFPTSPTNKNLFNVLPFQILGDSRSQIDAAILAVKVGDRETVESDFGLAIIQAVDIIQRFHPQRGGNILLVKVAGANNTATFTMEREVKLALSTAGVGLFAIEIDSSAENGLNQTSDLTEGYTTNVRDSSDAYDKLQTFLDKFANQLGPPADVRQSNLEDENKVLTWKGIVEPGITYKIAALSDSDTLDLFLVSRETDLLDKITAGTSTGHVWEITGFSNASEFLFVPKEDPLKGSRRTSEAPTRMVYFKKDVETPKPGVLTYLEFTFEGTEPGQLMVLTKRKVPPGMPGSLEGPEGLRVSLSTSAPNGLVDFAEPINPTVPFTISAHVTYNKEPVTEADVSALFRRSNDDLEELRIWLRDDGSGGADLVGDDGIYTAVVRPEYDGEYSAVVNVTKIVGSSKDKLMSIPMPPGLMATVTLKGTVEFVNVGQFKEKATRIRDFHILEASPTRVNFQLTVPTYLDGAKETLLREIRVYFSPTIDKLIDFEGDAEKVYSDVLREDQLPGTPVPIQVDLTTRGYYLATIYTEEELISRSNIVEVIPEIFKNPSTAFPGSTDHSDSDLTTSDSPLPTDASTASTGRSISTEKITTSDLPSTISGKTTESESSELPGSTEPTTWSTSEGSSTSTEEPRSGRTTTTKKPWAKTSGGIAIIVILALLGCACIGGGFWYYWRTRD